MLRRPKRYTETVEKAISELDLEPTIPIETFTDITPFFRGGKHALIQGITGSGKTTLLLTLVKMLHERGHIILFRDDGGLEFLYLLPEIPMTIFIPKGCRLKIKGDYRYSIKYFENAMDIIQQIYHTRYDFNVIVYDAFCLDPSISAQFWSELFNALIFKCMQTPRDLKEKLVFSIDELNDLVQPKGHELTEGHQKVRALLEYNIRKLRKHLVTLIATTHRFNMIGMNVRTQFSYIFMKKSFGWDIYEWLNKSLITASNKLFWSILRDIITLPQEYFYVFDYKGNYDKFRFNDIERPKIKYEVEGIIEPPKADKDFDEIDVILAIGRAMNPPIPFNEIAKMTNRSTSTIYYRYEKLMRRDHIAELLLQAKQKRKKKLNQIIPRTKQFCHAKNSNITQN